MTFDRLTWIGLMITALGWTLLLSLPQLTELFASFSVRPGVYSNMPTIAECTILTGLGLAILGALHAGFGALNNFFESVLERAGKARAKPSGARSAQPKKIVERGWVKDRAYILYMDGSVEVETLLGRRIFSSLHDAQEFIA